MAKITIDVPDEGCKGCRFLEVSHSYKERGDIMRCTAFKTRVFDYKKFLGCELVIRSSIKAAEKGGESDA